jgi:hypothetical protein
MSTDFGASQTGFFAYNEVPTIAVAMLVGFRARHISTRPFLCPLCFISFLFVMAFVSIQSLKASR